MPSIEIQISLGDIVDELEMTLYLICLIGYLGLSIVMSLVRPSKMRVMSKFTLAIAPDWLKRDNEIVIEKSLADQINPKLFDDPSSDHEMKSVFAKMSLMEISRYYQFSLDFLGDYCVQLGARSPIDIDCPIENFLTGSDVFSLMEALNSLDPSEGNVDYQTMTLDELASELGVPALKIIDMCEEKNFNLPFGTSTVLHQSLVNQIVESCKGTFE